MKVTLMGVGLAAGLGACSAVPPPRDPMPAPAAAEDVVDGAQEATSDTVEQVLPRFVDVAAGGDHTCLLTVAGRVACMGDNASGQLGLMDPSTPSELRQVAGLVDVQAISAGANHTCALTAGGRVACWGDNSAGQLGVELPVMSAHPVHVQNLDDAVAVSAGAAHSCALRAEGLVRCWGSNAAGQLGTDDPAARQAEVELAAPIVAVAAGAQQTCAITEAGQVVCWGSPSPWSNAAMIEPRPQTVLELDSASRLAVGQLWGCATSDTTTRCWQATRGQSSAGWVRTVLEAPAFAGLERLDVEEQLCGIVPQQGLVCSSWSSTWALGGGTSMPAPLELELHDVGLPLRARSVALGRDHACAVLEDGSAWCWGSNAHGKAGVPTDGLEELLVPVALRLEREPASEALDDVVELVGGARHLCARRRDGSVWCWGDNQRAQIGDGTTAHRQVARRVLGVERAVALSAAADQSCALTAEGQVVCWGDNASGQLGRGIAGGHAAIAAPVGCIDTAAVAVTVAAEHACALLEDGRVVCWGRNRFGQLGHDAEVVPLEGEVEPQAVCRTMPLEGAAQAVVALPAHTCVQTSARSLVCWGGLELRREPGTAPEGPIEVEIAGEIETLAAGSLLCARLTNGVNTCVRPPVEPFDGPPRTVELPDVARHAAHLSLGTTSCGVDDKGVLWCWGDNFSGTIGDGTTDDAAEPQRVIGLATVRQVVSALSHTCALLDSGAVECWGSDEHGQLGDPEPLGPDGRLSPGGRVHVAREPWTAWPVLPAKATSTSE